MSTESRHVAKCRQSLWVCLPMCCLELKGKKATYMHPDMVLVVCVWLGKTKIHIAQITSHVFSQNSHFTNLSISILAVQTV